MAEDERVAELVTRLARVRLRIAEACQVAGRDVSSVKLLAVTKYHPAEDILTLIRLGQRYFAESREPDATRKIGAVSAQGGAVGAEFVMIGRLQRNKARSVVRWADQIQSLDSERLALAVNDAVARRDDPQRSPAESPGGSPAVSRDQAPVAGAVSGEQTPEAVTVPCEQTPHQRLSVLIQVSLDGDTSRGGVPAAGVLPLAETIAATEHLRLSGVMAVAPLAGERRYWLERAAAIAAEVRAAHPDATELSLGMSDDLEHAIEVGSTCVRVGTALLGPRPLVST